MTNEHMNEWALHAYADGELSAEQRAEVEALMARDPEAARKVADWKRQRELLKAAFGGVLDEPVPQQLAAALRERTAPSRLSPWLAMVAAMLLLLFGGLGGWFLKGETAPTAVADLGQQALEAHSVFAVEVRHPVEVPGTEKAHLQAWLSKRVGPRSWPRRWSHRHWSQLRELASWRNWFAMKSIARAWRRTKPGRRW